MRWKPSPRYEGTLLSDKQMDKGLGGALGMGVRAGKGIAHRQRVGRREGGG